jgi:flagellar hook-associated protein 2
MCDTEVGGRAARPPPGEDQTMSGITSGVGIFSGINTGDLIDQLIAIDARPKTLIQRRIVQLQSQQAGYLSLNSALSALKTAAAEFTAAKVFQANRATASDDKVVRATAGTTAAEGTYTFLVDRLVTTQQRLSRGFADKDNAAVGATRFTFEVGGGGVSTETTLSELNGGLGVARGKMSITDRSGKVGTIDLSKAVTVNDVVDAINASTDIDVTASVEGDRVVLTDNTGATASNLIVQDAFGSTTASSLGITGSVAGTTLTGSAVRTLNGASALRSLNDGNGVDIQEGAADLRIVARDGQTLIIDLGKQTKKVFAEDFGAFSKGDDAPEPPPEGAEIETITTQAKATTIQDVIDIINKNATTAGVGITASINGAGTGLVITDTTGGSGNLVVRSQTNRTTAEDLGIATDPPFDPDNPAATGVASSTVAGKRLIAGINSVLTRNLNGGTGIADGALSFTDRAGVSHSFSLTQGALEGSLSDVIAEINAGLAGAGVGIRAGLNRAGNGIALTDSSGGNGALVASGAGADALGIATAGASSNTVDGSNLQHRWITKNTALSSLNVGAGVGTGEFRITDSDGVSTTINLTSSVATVGELLSLINSRPNVEINARINDTGDGIVIEDMAGGSNDLIIEDVSGTVAKSLNLRGTFEAEGGVLVADGSYEREVEFLATDSLATVASKINLAGTGVIATVINDGGGANPFRLNFVARNSGADGRAILDTGGLDLGLSTLSRGDDAVAFFGSTDPAKAILLTSSSNSLDGVVEGVSIDLLKASESPVELTVSRDTEKIEGSISEFVDAYNDVMAALDSLTFFDSETNRRGALFGDSTASGLRQRLVSAAQGSPTGVEGQFQFLFQVGVRLGTGSKLEFDSTRFRAALASDFDNVSSLFSAKTRQPSEPIELAPGVTTPNTTEEFSALGVGGSFERLVDSLTNSIDGLLTRRNQTIDNQVDAQNDRIASIDKQLERKRAKLQAQFAGMEQALALLSQQQSALGSIRSIG